jgi:hypothetical protein
MKKGRRGVGHFGLTSHKSGGICVAQRSPFSRRQRGDGRLQCGSYLSTARKTEMENGSLRWSVLIIFLKNRFAA